MGTLPRDRHGRQIGANDPGSLAAAAGISQGYRSQLEADEREPTLAIAARLAQASACRSMNSRRDRVFDDVTQTMASKLPIVN